MAAQIKPGPSSNNDKFNSNRKPVLLAKLEGCSDSVNKAILIPETDGVISVSSDRTVRVWLKRDSGQYWPSICNYLPSPAVDLFYRSTTRQLFIGQENGTISEYILEEDFNRMEPIGDILAHHGRLTGIIWTEVAIDGTLEEWILSTARDKRFQYHNAKNGNPIGPPFVSTSWCTSLEYDPESAHAFVGDYSGNITMLNIKSDGLKVVTTLTGHTASVEMLIWDSSSRRLFSAGHDRLIIIWDIGGGQGTAYELHGHTNRVTSLAFVLPKNLLISAGEDSVMVFWDLNAQRKETPPWTESDNCESCSRPFLWNISGIFERKQFGSRQHHCRSCGRALCDKCSQEQSTIPSMGFELPVRVCKFCSTNIDHTPMATFHDAKHSVVTMTLDLQRKCVVTIGQDRIIKIWDVSAFI
ncbi:WD repeat and FYVE domain-containing protein 2 [Adelges cooleyi]|uniref:WD repeat and FYVE domain-containing protein 2 n=1 Tax=Adelges cooleyi TaxID=133065 RepID=UPI00217F8E2E|nr:WD repeat and FYVE domain-containing protein 2 [Adelges cooleyi]XP_050438436.1 WD repeat and FYVE domain-containing protein 2 [Adelges cooleyi]